jgi:hypothetical protein
MATTKSVVDQIKDTLYSEEFDNDLQNKGVPNNNDNLLKKVLIDSDDLSNFIPKKTNTWTQEATNKLIDDMNSTSQLTYLCKLAEDFYKNRWQLLERVVATMMIVNVLLNAYNFLTSFDSEDLSGFKFVSSASMLFIISIMITLTKLAPNYLKYSKKMLEYHDYNKYFSNLHDQVMVDVSVNPESRGEAKPILDKYMTLLQNRPDKVPNHVITQLRKSGKFNEYTSPIIQVCGLSEVPKLCVSLDEFGYSTSNTQLGIHESEDEMYNSVPISSESGSSQIVPLSSGRVKPIPNIPTLNLMTDANYLVTTSVYQPSSDRINTPVYV